MQSWYHWYWTGKVGAWGYAEQYNWIFLSRDLLSIPRRWMLTFNERHDFAQNSDNQPIPTALGVGLVVLVVGLTSAIVLLSLLDSARRRQVLAFTGPGAAFILLGCHFSCYHFIYYDTTVALLPMFLLFSEPRKYLVPRFFNWRPVSPIDRAYYGPTLERLTPPRLPLSSGYRPRWVVNPLPPILLLVLLVQQPICIRIQPDYFFPPYDTFLLLILWAWCGWQVICGPYAESWRTAAPLATKSAAGSMPDSKTVPAAYGLARPPAGGGPVAGAAGL